MLQFKNSYAIQVDVAIILLTKWGEMLQSLLKKKGIKTMTKNESGRSMVEMLGVLAIIGVLSVGGIAGYTMAMKKYKAHNVVDCISKLSVAAEVARTGATAPASSDYCSSNMGDCSFSATAGSKVVSVGGCGETLAEAVNAMISGDLATRVAGGEVS